MNGSITNRFILLKKIVLYNLKIIFANRFIWFFLAAFGFFVFFLINRVWQGDTADAGLAYGILIFPGILLIFYPTAFGIQNDEDARVLEILFGIPNYRYKVWLVRLVIIFFQVYIILALFSTIVTFLLYPVNPFEMAGYLMFPIVFLGSLSFMFSTIIKNGNGTAVVMVIIGIALMIFSEFLEKTLWNIFLNPYDIPRDFNPVIWQSIALKNKIFLGAGTVVFILTGLLNLQKRERFV